MTLSDGASARAVAAPAPSALPAMLSPRQMLESLPSWPARLGALEEVRLVPQAPKQPRPFLIHVETAHGSESSAKKLSRTLHSLYRRQGVKLFLLEGAAGPLEPQLDRLFGRPQWDAEIGRMRMRHGRM